MAEQLRKLMAMLGTAVNGLGNWDAVRPAVEALGARHSTYGVKPEDYSVVGEALLATLGMGLGPDFTPEVGQAWRDCYAVITDVMLIAAGETSQV